MEVIEVINMLCEPRDTVNYTLYDGCRMVYHGITNDLERRLDEHERDGKFFTGYSYSALRTRSSALQHEAEDIGRYVWSQGRLPQYNKR